MPSVTSRSSDAVSPIVPFLSFAPIVRLDYSTGTAPLDRLRAFRGVDIGAALVNWPNSTPYALGWDGRDRYDYAAYDALLDQLLRERADLKFILSFGSLHGAPYYWARDNPDQLAVFHCGRRMQQPSLGSVRWREHSTQAARRFAAHFCQGRHRDRIVGFYPYSTAVAWHGIGETLVNIPPAETPKTPEYPLEGDISTPMLESFRAFLAAKYVSDEALQEAWRDPDASRSTARLPSRIEVRSPSNRVRDYFEHYNQLNAQLALSWSEALKSEALHHGAPAWRVFISHGSSFGWPAENLHAQGSGHNAPERLFRSPHIDTFVSSIASPRVALCPLSQHPLASLRHNRKFHVHSIEPPNLSAQAPAAQLPNLSLQVGYAATEGSGIAWGEVRHGPGSMQDDRGRFAPLPYDHDVVRSHLRFLLSWHSRHLSRSPRRRAELAVIVSPRAAYGRALNSQCQRECVERFRTLHLARAGVSFDEFIQDDFADVADRYRGWIWLDTPDIDGAAWQLVRRHRGRSLFVTCGEPLPSPDEIRRFSRSVGSHVWCRSNDALFVDSHAIAFACHESGEKVIDLPESSTVRDAISGEILGASTRHLAFAAQAGDVRLLELSTD